MRFIVESLWVGLGAFIGANARYWFGVLARATHQEFPWPTLTINVLGSAALGVFAAAALERGYPWHIRAFFAIGLCGGFTTFSAFSFEVIDLVYRRSWKLALVYALVSVITCVGGCLLGGHLGRLAFGTTQEGSPFAEPGEPPVNVLPKR
ncbi:MAG TPA: fluoride efflux transporter CrcB [Fimbriimonadaceae bacterium]|nr:fluoride efflux transporter CrcB [Fimbriimonadaceae bacterium]